MKGNRKNDKKYLPSALNPLFKLFYPWNRMFHSQSACVKEASCEQWGTGDIMGVTAIARGIGTGTSDLTSVCGTAL